MARMLHMHPISGIIMKMLMAPLRGSPMAAGYLKGTSPRCRGNAWCAWSLISLAGELDWNPQCPGTYFQLVDSAERWRGKRRVRVSVSKQVSLSEYRLGGPTDHPKWRDFTTLVMGRQTSQRARRSSGITEGVNHCNDSLIIMAVR